MNGTHISQSARHWTRGSVCSYLRSPLISGQRFAQQPCICMCIWTTKHLPKLETFLTLNVVLNLVQLRLCSNGSAAIMQNTHALILKKHQKKQNAKDVLFPHRDSFCDVRLDHTKTTANTSPNLCHHCHPWCETPSCKFCYSPLNGCLTITYWNLCYKTNSFEQHVTHCLCSRTPPSNLEF